MTEPASPSTVPSTPTAPAAAPPKGKMSDAELMEAVYAAGIGSGDEEDGAVVEAVEKKPEAEAEQTSEAEPPQAVAEKTEEATTVEEASPKATEEEIEQAATEIEAAKKDLLEHRQKLVDAFGKLQRREAKVDRKSQELEAKTKAHAESVKRFEVERDEWLADVKALAEGDVNQKIRVLQKRGGNQDIADFVTKFNETTIGAQPADRELRRELAELKDLVRKKHDDDEQRRITEEKARETAAQKAEYDRQVQQGIAHVRQQLGGIVKRADDVGFGPLAEVAKLAGEQAAFQLLLDVGNSLAQRGHQYPFADAAIHIANECDRFLRGTDQGREYLKVLRERAVKASSPSTPATGSRTASPGTSLSAAAASAPGPSRSDLSLQEDALEHMRALDDNEYAERYLPRDVRVA